MSAEMISAKRPGDGSQTQESGQRKRLNISNSDNERFVNFASGKVIRLLCPALRIDGVIGKGGSIISQICQETGAKVRVGDTVPGCDERVIVIVGSGREDDASRGVSDNHGEPENKGDEPRKSGGSPEKVAASSVSQTPKEKETSSIQKAMLAVFEKMFNESSETKKGNEGNGAPSSYVARLLVFSGQVGCLLGKAGSVIKQMSSESGAQIRILPKDKLPPCASTSDELVQISGTLDAIRKALKSVFMQLLENYPRNQDSSATIVGSSSDSIAIPPKQDRFPPFNRHFHGHGAPFYSGFHDVQANNPIPEVLSFRLLSSEEKVGGVIGKGGSIVKALQHETGCEINVLEGGVDSEDRIIVISGPVFHDDGISAPQDAVLKVQCRIFRAAPESKDKTLTAKLLVSSHQIGCLLGKGGSVIAEMRKSTGAYIRILGKDQVPKNASENEEVVQVNGELKVVLEALMQITTKLRNHFFRDVFPRHWGERMPPFPHYMNREFPAPGPGLFSHQGPSFSNFDGPGDHPTFSGGFRLHDDRPPFPVGFPGPGFPHVSERMPPASMWGPEGPVDRLGPIAVHDFPGAPLRRHGGFTGRGLQGAVITNTTVELVVPRFVVPAIYGEGGGCLRQICEISEAKIMITDPKPGATETLIIISGVPEQVNAAQSLIQAFVISETEGLS